MESFIEAQDEEELILPSSMTSDEVDTIREISRDRGLSVVVVEKPKRRVTIVKKLN